MTKDELIELSEKAGNELESLFSILNLVSENLQVNGYQQLQQELSIRQGNFSKTARELKALIAKKESGS